MFIISKLKKKNKKKSIQTEHDMIKRFKGWFLPLLRCCCVSVFFFAAFIVFQVNWMNALKLLFFHDFQRFPTIRSLPHRHQHNKRNLFRKEKKEKKKKKRNKFWCLDVTIFQKKRVFSLISFLFYRFFIFRPHSYNLIVKYKWRKKGNKKKKKKKKKKLVLKTKFNIPAIIININRQQIYFYVSYFFYYFFFYFALYFTLRCLS